jgi:hypothetical protein
MELLEQIVVTLKEFSNRRTEKRFPKAARTSQEMVLATSNFQY